MLLGLSAEEAKLLNGKSGQLPVFILTDCVRSFYWNIENIRFSFMYTWLYLQGPRSYFESWGGGGGAD